MRRFVLLSVALVGLVSLPLGCQRTDSPARELDAPSGPPWFEDVTEQRGLHFLHDAGPTGDYFMPQQVGSGAALFDFDGDGLLDIYLLQNGGPKSASTNRLYQQMPDHHFRDVSKGSGLDIAGNNMGVAVGDINNDGKPDLLITQYGGVKLFLNQGGGTFLDVTKAAGLDNPAWGTSAAFFDYDRDGWLDLVVVSYIDYDPTWPCSGATGEQDYCAPKTFKGRVSRLFHNLGRDGNSRAAHGPGVRFQDVTESSGLGRVPGPGLGVVCADFDGDGWPDIFIANDGQPNRLWLNHKDGTFREEAVLRGVAYNNAGQAQAGMGIALGDVDGDGRFDLFVTHLSEETNTLWRQEPRGLFQDKTQSAGLLTASWKGTGFGTVFADFDHDGWLDLAIVNGRVSKRGVVTDWSLGPFWSRYGDRNQLFRNDGRGVFSDVSRSNDAFCGRSNVARGLARGDIDNDGAEDLLVTAVGLPARLYRNIAPKQGHWLRVRALLGVGTDVWRDALGTEVRVRAGGRTWVSWLHPAQSYLCSSEPCAHFGLGPASQVDTIDVVWPDGARETFPGCDANRRIELRKGQGRSAPP